VERSLDLFIAYDSKHILFFAEKCKRFRKHSKPSFDFRYYRARKSAIFILLLVFLVSKKDSPILSPYTIYIAILLISYYALWIFCFADNKNLTILLGMAVLPVAYFILAEIWLHNFPAIIPTVIFGIAHIIITYIDCRPIY